MILYFDSYITDIPLPGRSRDQLREDIRKNCKAYKMPKRIDIAKYTLASYALYPWSYVLIRYELDTPKEYKNFDTYIKSLFPKAKIIHKRSDNQKEYRKSLKILEKYNDDWIFYAPNNDHPIISSNAAIAQYINQLITLAEKWKKKYKYVSIIYSHFSEFLNIPIKGTPAYEIHGHQTTIVSDDLNSRIYMASQGEFASVQIVHKNLLRKWFDSLDLDSKKIIRAEDIKENVTLQNHIIIVPKEEICAHFDGYEHMLGHPNEIQSDQIPPLFIPSGFFENKIKIAYGYPTYREGWVNINPLARKYSFRDHEYGTDLKITLDTIPAMWINRIEQIDVNPGLNQIELENTKILYKKLHANPWSLSVQDINLTTGKFWIRYGFFRLNILLRSKLSATKKFKNII